MAEPDVTGTNAAFELTDRDETRTGWKQGGVEGMLLTYFSSTGHASSILQSRVTIVSHSIDIRTSMNQRLRVKRGGKGKDKRINM